MHKLIIEVPSKRIYSIRTTQFGQLLAIGHWSINPNVNYSNGSRQHRVSSILAAKHNGQATKLSHFVCDIICSAFTQKRERNFSIWLNDKYNCWPSRVACETLLERDLCSSKRLRRKYKNELIEFSLTNNSISGKANYRFFVMVQVASAIVPVWPDGDGTGTVAWSSKRMHYKVRSENLRFSSEIRNLISQWDSIALCRSLWVCTAPLREHISKTNSPLEAGDADAHKNAI